MKIHILKGDLFPAQATTLVEKQSLKIINKVQSKYNFTNSASKLLKNCQGVLSKEGKIFFKQKTHLRATESKSARVKN